MSHADAWSSTAAESWDQAVTAGSGVVGALLFGSPARHSIVFTHERFFVPVNSRRPAPELAPVLGRVRSALDRRDEVTAADIVEARLRELGIDPDELVWTDPLGPIAQLVWETGTRSTHGYRRDLDVAGDGAAVSWAIGGGRSSIDIRTVHGAEWFEIELRSDVEQTGRLTLGRVTEEGASATTVATENHSGAVDAAFTAADGGLVAEIHARGREPGTACSARVTVETAAHHVLSGHAWVIRVGPDTPVVLRVSIHTDAPGPELSDASEDTGAVLGRSRLTVGGVAPSNASVEEIWALARNGDAAAEAKVVELAYAAGRRNIYAASGGLPPTLQGVWQGTWSPAWSADYTMNGNVQLGTMAAVLWTGMPEVMPSLFRLIEQFPDDYRRNASSIFGVDGMLLPSRLTTHGHMNHFLRSYPHEFWIGHGSWLIRMAVDYIQVTGDRSMVDEWLWEYTQEILAFGLGVVEAAGGHFSPAYSPENTPRGRDNPLATDAAAEIGALRDGLRAGAWLAHLMGDDALAARWHDARASLPRYRIAADGSLGEWSAEWPEEIAHRHASQLHGLWYETDEWLREPALRDAALATIRAKIAWRAEDPTGPPGRMEMAFGLSSLGIAAAALGDSAAAYQCALWLARDHFTPALMTTHDAGAIFNLDASGALPAVVSAMLVASSVGRITLLPALPVQWAAGEVTGLGTRGGAELQDLVWSNQGLSAAISLPKRSAWLRPARTTLELPNDGRLIANAGVTQIGPNSLEVDPDITSASFTFQYK
jgi:hypothetical protein